MIEFRSFSRSLKMFARVSMVLQKAFCGIRAIDMSLMANFWLSAKFLSAPIKLRYACVGVANVLTYLAMC